MYAVILEYADGRDAVIERHIADLAAAARFAIDLAERASLHAGDGHGPPVAVKICNGDRLEIAFSVAAIAAFRRGDGTAQPPN